MEVGDLVEIELIKRAKYRYMRCLDQKLWVELGAVLTNDAVASYGGGKHRLRGRDAIVSFLESALGSTQRLSSHRVGHPEIVLTSSHEANGTWAMEDEVVLADLGVTVRGAAFYEDTYRKVEGDWLIARTGYRRTYEEVVPRASVRGLRLTASWWEEGGRSQLEAGA